MPQVHEALTVEEIDQNAGSDHELQLLEGREGVPRALSPLACELQHTPLLATRGMGTEQGR